MRRDDIRGRGAGWGPVFVCGILAALAGCESMHKSKDFERHRYSQLSEPYERNDVIYFDVKFDANYPDEDPGAEQIRMEWLQAWLDQRQMCGDGYVIDKRRPFDMMENNPARYDMRYEVKCKIDATS